MMTTGDLAGLACDGVARSERTACFDAPIECTFEPDGTVRIAMNDPVTDRFRAAVLGARWWAGRTRERDMASFTLHEREKDRIGGLCDRTARGSAGAVRPTIRLQWQGLRRVCGWVPLPGLRLLPRPACSRSVCAHARPIAP